MNFARQRINSVSHRSNQSFRLSVTTTSSPQTVTITRVRSDRPFHISWGDGTKSSIAANHNTTITHSYTNAGTYRVNIERPDRIYHIQLIASSVASCEPGEIKKLINVQTLYLQNLSGIQISAGELGRLRKLKVLYCHGQDENKIFAHSGELAMLTNLEELALFRTKNVPLASGEVRNFPNLRLLSLSGDTVIAKIIGSGDLSTLTQLQTLSLSGVSVTTGYGEIGSLVNLTSLSLTGSYPNVYVAAGELGQLTLLTNLNLNTLPNVESGPGELASLTNLTNLFIWFCDLLNPNAGLSSLHKLTSMTWRKASVMPQSECDSILQQIYEMGANRIATGGTITISNGESISLPDGPVCPPASGGAYRYELLNNSCGNYPKTWTTVTTPSLADPVLPDELADLGALTETSRLKTPVGFNDVV